MMKTDSFGVIRPRYEISDDRVAIYRRRSPWVMFLSMVPASAVLALIAWPRLGQGGPWLGLFMLATFAGCAGLYPILAMQWLAPSQIVFTRGGVQWGAHACASSDIKQIWLSGGVALPRASAAQLTTQRAYYLQLSMKSGKARTLQLATTSFGGAAIEQRVRELGHAIGPLLDAAGISFLWAKRGEA
jgi:hypothetical protein